MCIDIPYEREKEREHEQACITLNRSLNALILADWSFTSLPLCILLNVRAARTALGSPTHIHTRNQNCAESLLPWQPVHRAAYAAQRLVEVWRCSSAEWLPALSRPSCGPPPASYRRVSGEEPSPAASPSRAPSSVAERENTQRKKERKRETLYDF